MRTTAATLASTNARIDSLVTDVAEIKALLLAASVPASAPAKARTRKPAKAVPAQEEAPFVTWLKETAEARAERKTSNADLAQKVRDLGYNPTGQVWALAKAGKFGKAGLTKAAAADLAAAAARKAAK